MLSEMRVAGMPSRCSSQAGEASALEERAGFVGEDGDAFAGFDGGDK